MSRSQHPWTTSDIPDQSGRTFVVTGANSGLGLATASVLAERNAHVVMACRNRERAEEARQTIPAGARDNTEIRELDLADLDSVTSFVDGMDWRRVDVLVNNAGLMNVPFARTPQGHEMQFGTNVLGHFALTARLLPTLTDRVVWLGSLAHRFGRIHLDDLDYRTRTYRGMEAYAQSKLACTMLAYEQQRRFVRSGSTLRAVLAHPGYTATNIQLRNGGAVTDRFMKLGNSIKGFVQTPEEGARPQLYAATEPDLPGGWFVGPDGFGQFRGAPRPMVSTRRSHDPVVAAELWRRCEEMTGVTA